MIEAALNVLGVIAVCMAYWWATEGRREREREMWLREMRAKRPRR